MDESNVGLGEGGVRVTPRTRTLFIKESNYGYLEDTFCLCSTNIAHVVVCGKG